MTQAAAGLVLGFVLATAYGAGFHLLQGGPARRVVLYVLAAWLGFALGQLIGDWLNIEIFLLGAVHLLPASIGAWATLFASRWLAIVEVE